MNIHAQVKCACPSCDCPVEVATAITKEGKNYCNDACANSQPDCACCGSDDCGCAS
ncbi:MAG: metallothionein [Cyanobacteria bacterium P01_H01_bin.15]